MLVKLVKTITIAVTVAALLGVTAWGQQAQEKSPWKDRAEYDLYNKIVGEKDAAKKLQLLDSYAGKYPESKFKLQLQLMYTQTYQSLGQADKMYESAEKILAMDPKNVQGLYFITSLTASMGKTDAQHLSNGEKAAKALVSEVNGMTKPAQMSDANWKKQKDSLLKLGYQTLGWIAMNRKNNTAAEREFRQVLYINPTNAQVSYWLGTVILAQRDAAKQAEAFWHFARAANLTGDGEMTADGRKDVDAYLKKIYTSFHGDESDLDQIVTAALAKPFPPDGFSIKSKEVIAAEKDQQFLKDNPKLYMWLNVKKQLEAPGGAAYFNSQVKNTTMPSMRGYLISQSPQNRPDTLVLGIADRSTREVTIKLDTAFRYQARRGTVLNFKCVPQRFAQSPFNLGFDCQRDDVSGWPPPPSRKTTR